MKLSYKLEEMFPTEESRFDAYKKWVIFSAIFGPITLLSDHVLEYLLKIAERSYHVPESINSWIGFLSLLSIMGFVFTLVSFYIFFYISWKSNVIKAFLKMLLGIIIGTMIMILLLAIFPPLSLIVPIIGLYMNWARVKRYWDSNDRFVKDNLKLMSMALLGFIVLIVGGVISFITSTRYHFNYPSLILTVIVAVALFFIWPPIYVINAFNREKELGNTFFKAFYQFSMTGIFIWFSIIALTASIHHNFFDGNVIVDDLTGDFSNPTMAGAEHIYAANPDMTATDYTDVNSGVGTDFNPDIGYVHPETTGFMHNNADLNHMNPTSDSFVHDTGVSYDNPGAEPFIHNTDMYRTNTSAGDMHVGFDSTHPDMNSHIDGTFAHSTPDLMDGNFMHVYGGTNMADIPNIQHHPYMIFNDPSVQGNFQVCDPNGMPQMTITNGNIVDSEYTIIGRVNTDAVSGTTTFTDINNNPLYSVDSHGQMFSGNHYIGHTDTSGDVTIIRDMNNNIVARYDKLTHTWFDKMSKPISQIKMM